MAAVGLLIGACANNDSTRRPLVAAEPGSLTPTRRAPPDRYFLPDHEPAGLHLETVVATPPYETEDGVTLYGDPEADDPLREPWVAVVYQGGSETGPSLPKTGRPIEAGRVAVQGRTGWTGTIGGLEWVTWQPEDDDQEIDQFGVVARGIPRDDLLVIAEHASLLSKGVPQAALVPDAFQPLASAPISLAGLEPAALGHLRPPGATLLRWTAGDGRQLSVLSLEANMALLQLMRVAIDDFDGTKIRGEDGSAGPASVGPDFDAPSPRLARTWREQGVVVYVAGVGVPEAEIDRVVESLRLSAGDDWERLRDQASNYPIDASSAGEKVVVSGRFDGGYWVLSVHGDGPGYQLSEIIKFADGTFAGGLTSSGGSVFAAGQSSSESGNLVYGVVPRDVARVRVVLSDGSQHDAELIDAGPSYPARFFGLWTEPDVNLQVVSAFAPDGRETFRVVPERPLTPRSSMFARGRPPD